jgi:hypothetical protein
MPHEAHEPGLDDHDVVSESETKSVVMVTHGLAVLVGIYSFMFIERLLSIISRLRRRGRTDLRQVLE